MTGGLGRRIPTDFDHVAQYPLRRLVTTTVDVAERTLKLPHYRVQYDQGVEGACVGFACSWMVSIFNRRLYDAGRLYREAQLIDEWHDTPPSEGTSVRAGLDVLRTIGHWRVRNGRSYAADVAHGILENRWATTVDEVRTAIQSGSPVVLGVNWYSTFDRPERVQHRVWSEYWIGCGELGRIRGGHAICAYRVSDKRQAVGLVNSWGKAYPLVWLGYDVLQRLIDEHGECGLVTDRP